MGCANIVLCDSQVRAGALAFLYVGLRRLFLKVFMDTSVRIFSSFLKKQLRTRKPGNLCYPRFPELFLDTWVVMRSAGHAGCRCHSASHAHCCSASRAGCCSASCAGCCLVSCAGCCSHSHAGCCSGSSAGCCSGSCAGCCSVSRAGSCSASWPLAHAT